MSDDELLPGEKPEGICGWVPSCNVPSGHTVRKNTRPGVVLTFEVCDLHRDTAVSMGWEVEA